MAELPVPRRARRGVLYELQMKDIEMVAAHTMVLGILVLSLSTIFRNVLLVVGWDLFSTNDPDCHGGSRGMSSSGMSSSGGSVPAVFLAMNKSHHTNYICRREAEFPIFLEEGI